MHNGFHQDIITVALAIKSNGFGRRELESVREREKKCMNESMGKSIFGRHHARYDARWPIEMVMTETAEVKEKEKKKVQQTRIKFGEKYANHHEHKHRPNEMCFPWHTGHSYAPSNASICKCSF